MCRSSVRVRQGALNYIGVWCNGSIFDSDSNGIGSNPITPTMVKNDFNKAEHIACIYKFTNTINNKSYIG